MRLHRPSSRSTPSASRSGVALIITVIMLSVITFLAVAFLALSGRERGQVKTATDQTTARLAADTAMVRVQGELLAGYLAAGSVENYGFLVSTNYVNWRGYDPNPVVQTIGTPNPTNVNYYDASGALLTGNNALQNLANQLYDPSPPVFITNRFFANTMEFRSYVDLNRNRRLDLTGYWGVTNSLNQALKNTNGLFVSNYVTGDPQWIGAHERPDQPASATNRYPYRYAYAAVPVGKTLDVNYIHNQALASGTMDALGRNFFRNQGVGPWEINLAAFLYDLNTNDVYGWGIGNAGYFYNPLTGTPGTPASGKAFVDAGGLYRYRLNGGPNLTTYATTTPIGLPLTNGLATVNDLYGPSNPFTTDFVDDYSDGLLVYTNGLGAPSPGLLLDTDNPSRPWVGANQSYHFFTTQDLFDPKKTDTGGGMMFNERLNKAGTNFSTYDQYTFSRLEEQLGTDSAPDDSDKLNINYKVAGVSSGASFVPWTPTEFFTNAANRLLSKYTQDWLDTDASYYTNFYGTNQAFGLTNIPVVISNRFVYTPAVHRLLQLAANLVDIKTDTLVPSVFRPIFTRNNNGIFITGYELAPTNSVDIYLRPPPIEVADLPFGSGLSNNVFGVPWVVGAKKGLPNFNEVSMHSLFEVTRKLQLTRPSVTAPASQWRTNMMYVVGVSNAIGVEAWNSYRNDFTNPVVIRVAGFVRMALTNEFGIPLSSVSGPLTNNFIPLIGVSNMTVWKGYGAGTTPNPRSFIIPVRTNIAFLPESVYNIASKTFTTNLNVGFEPLTSFVQPRWGLVTSVRLRVVMQLNDANGPIIDYVQLDDLGGARDLSEEIRDPDGELNEKGLWATNIVKSLNLPMGLVNQINISLGLPGTDAVDWQSYDKQSHPTKDLEIAYFRAFCGASPDKYPTVTSTNLVQQVPFTPTKRVLQQTSWQANDPLVHYLAGDLLDIAKTNNVETPALTESVSLLKNIGVINDRYSPWGGNPINTGDTDGDEFKFNAALKDPGVGSSDDWQFPTNALPGIGQLGRVHRGTPWQTVYLKASDLNISQMTVPIANMGNWLGSYPAPAGRWMQWSGNSDPTNSYFTRPTTDRLLFDVFTTALNENASRGQLSVNQTNLASWSALFSGVVTLTNSFASLSKPPRFDPLVIQPAGVYNAFDPGTWPPLVKLVSGINAERSRSFTNGAVVNYVHPGGWFQSAGDILSVPELTDASPFLNLNTNSISFQNGVNDVAYEWLPQQVMSLLRLGEPRFVIYAYGQALRPAENSIVTAGTFSGLCTNYQITAEVAARAVVRVVGSANPKDINNANPKRRYPPRLVVESYNYLPPE